MCSTRSSPASTSSSSIPTETSVGYGGLPNADGVVQLDSCCMHGPKKRAGGVAALEGVRTPSLVAQAVMDETDHHLIVGKGAQEFARSMGFKIEDDLNTERSRAAWLRWKRRTDPLHYLDPSKRAGGDAPCRVADDGRGADRAEPLLRHDQLQRRERQRRCLRRDDDERPGVQDSRPRRATRRFSAPVSTSTTTSAPRDRPGAAKRISTTSVRT